MEIFVCLSEFAQRLSLDLSSPKTQIRKHLEQLFRDPRPQLVSWSFSILSLVSGRWELCLLPCAGCCLMLQMSRKVKVLRSGDCRVTLQLEAALSGRKIDRRVVATDVDAELGLVTCVWSRIAQIGRRSTPGRSRARVRRMPDSGVGGRSQDRRERRELRNTQK